MTWPASKCSYVCAKVRMSCDASICPHKAGHGLAVQQGMHNWFQKCRNGLFNTSQEEEYLLKKPILLLHTSAYKLLVSAHLCSACFPYHACSSSQVGTGLGGVMCESFQQEYLETVPDAKEKFGFLVFALFGCPVCEKLSGPVEAELRTGERTGSAAALPSTAPQWRPDD